MPSHRFARVLLSLCGLILMISFSGCTELTQMLGKVHGRVTARDTGLPIAAIEVTADSAVPTQTDSAGNYTLTFVGVANSPLEIQARDGDGALNGGIFTTTTVTVDIPVVLPFDVRKDVVMSRSQ